MKILFYKLLLLGFTVLILGCFLASLITGSDAIMKVLNKNESCVYDAIRVSREGRRITYAILGDSVGGQLVKYSDSSLGYVVLTTVSPVSMAGQYVLLANLLESNDTLERVDLLCIPSSFSVDLDNKLTYNYFVKPFLSLRTTGMFSSLVYERLRVRPLYRVAMLPIFKISAFPQINYAQPKRSGGAMRPSSCISPVSVEFLLKMRSECKARGIRFRVLCPPVRQIDNTTLLVIKREIARYGLEDIFSEYFNRMIVLSPEKFSDGIHLKDVGPEEWSKMRDNIMQ